MGYLASRCESCGGMVDSNTCRCVQCGAVLKSALAQSDPSKVNYDMFKSGSAPAEQAPAKCAPLDDPYVWMYILAILFPILNIVMMGVYMNHNDFRNARKIYLIPAILQIIIYGAIVIMIMMFNM